MLLWVRHLESVRELESSVSPKSVYESPMAANFVSGPRVAFTASQMKRPLLGFAGFLQFFRACFDGESEAVELTTNRHYPGT